MYECEGLGIKKIEHRRSDAFELRYWRRLLRVLWTARKSNQSILKDISPKYSLAGLTLAIGADSWLIGKDPDAGKNWGQEKKQVTEDEMVGWHYWLNGYEHDKTQGDRDRQKSLTCCSSWGCKSTWLNDWTTTTQEIYIYIYIPQNNKIGTWEDPKKCWLKEQMFSVNFGPYFWCWKI